MQDANVALETHTNAADTQMKDTARLDQSHVADPLAQAKLPTIYGPRNPDVKISAERTDISEGVQTGERIQLIIKFRNLNLKVKGRQPKTERAFPPMQDSSDSEDDDETDGHGGAQAPAQTSGGGGKNKGNKSNKKKNKGRKSRSVVAGFSTRTES